MKALDPDELRSLGTKVLLGNAYHLHFRPGDGLVGELGGLHRFMGWDGPILTDSGGFQVFSLRDTIVAVDDDGVTFRSVYDGAAARFTPELVRVERLDRRLRPHRHEGGRTHLAMRCAEDPGARGAVDGGDLDVAHRISMASPNE